MLPQPPIAGDLVAVYIRWSTDDQSEGTTLAVQLERCKAFLALKGWTFREDLLYIDDGFSGGTLDRPALTRLREAVDSGRVGCVVVYKMDRLSRSVADIAWLVTREWAGRCHFQSASESLDTTTPTGKMFFYNLASFAEYERGVIKERTMSGKVKRAQQGFNPGFRPPFGLTRGSRPGEFAVVAHEAATVRRIFELYRTGQGGAAIAHLLNSEGVRNRGRLWSEQGIRRLLRNPAYAGILSYGRTARVPREQRQRTGARAEVRFARPRFALVERAVPCIVDETVWNEVQALLARRAAGQRAVGRRPTYSDYLLSGVAVCRCGAPIHGKRVRTHRYYYCSARKRSGAGVCGAGHIPAAAVEALVAEQVEQRLRSMNRAQGCEALVGGIAERMRELQGAIAGGDAELASLRSYGEKLQRDYRNGELTPGLYAREWERLEADSAVVRGRLAQAREALAVWAGLREDQQTLSAALASVNLWQDQTVPERKQLLRRITAGVVVYRERSARGPASLQIRWLDLEQDGEPRRYLASLSAGLALRRLERSASGGWSQGG